MSETGSTEASNALPKSIEYRGKVSIRAAHAQYHVQVHAVPAEDGEEDDALNQLN